MIKRSRAALSATLFCCLAAGAAAPSLACGGGKLVSEEKFAALPAWAAGSDKSAGPNGLSVTETTANTTWFSGPPDPIGNAEVCVTVSAQAPDQTDATAGLAFYFFNSENYYRAAVSNISGTFIVERRMAGQWVTIIPYSSNPAIRKGPTAENEISLRLSGQHALVSINDTPVGGFEAAVTFVNEKQQDYINLSWGSFSADKPAFTYTLKNLQVREVQ